MAEARDGGATAEAVWAAVALAGLPWDHPHGTLMVEILKRRVPELEASTSPLVSAALRAAHGLALLWDVPGSDRTFALLAAQRRVGELAVLRVGDIQARREVAA